MTNRKRTSWLWGALAVAVVAGGCEASDGGAPPKQQGNGGAGGEECTAGRTDCAEQGGGGSVSEGCRDGLRNGDETDVDCGGSCPKCELGKECSGSDDCDSKFCVEGVCCDGACDGPCQACTALRKESGEDGTCGPVTIGTACGGETSCSEGVQVNADACDAEGQCVSMDPTECGAYLCDAEGTACLTECAQDEDCVPCHACSPEGACVPAGPGEPGATCNGAGEACDAAGECKLANGEACTDAAECGSGSCVDGVCCNAACDGECQACDVEGMVGTCSTMAAGTQDPACTAPADVCDSAGACKKGAQATCTADEECASNSCLTLPGMTRVCAPVSP